MLTKATNVEELKPYMSSGAYLEQFEVVECALLYYREFADCFLLSSSREPGSGFNYLYLQLEEGAGLSAAQKEPLWELDKLVNELDRTLSDAIHNSRKADSSSLLHVKKVTSAGNERFLINATSAHRWINQQYGEERAAHFAELLGIEPSLENPDLQGTIKDEREEIPQAYPIKPSIPTSWEGITLSIYQGNRMKVSKDGEYLFQVDFTASKLIHQTTKAITQPGALLLSLADADAIPALRSGTKAADNLASTVSKIGRSLKDLTGIKGDPFLPFDKDIGYQPRFNLVDRRSASDERAETRAMHVQLSEETDKISDDLPLHTQDPADLADMMRSNGDDRHDH
jgi:hypothetical protein